MSHVSTQSYNHLIIMRTHRWPHGPCFYKTKLRSASRFNESEVLAKELASFRRMKLAFFFSYDLDKYYRHETKDNIKDFAWIEEGFERYAVLTDMKAK